MNSTPYFSFSLWNVAIFFVLLIFSFFPFDNNTNISLWKNLSLSKYWCKTLSYYLSTVSWIKILFFLLFQFNLNHCGFCDCKNFDLEILKMRNFKSTPSICLQSFCVVQFVERALLFILQWLETTNEDP